MLVKAVGVAAIVFASTSFADVTAFKLTLGKTTVEEAKQTYWLTPNGQNSASKGPMFSVAPDAIDFPNIQGFNLVFSENNTLSAIHVTLPRSEFGDLRPMLSQRYSVVAEHLPFVGNRRVTYEKDGVQIELNSPHLSFDTTLVYATDEFHEQVEVSMKEYEVALQQQRASAL